MNILTCVMAAVSLVAALDYIIGGKFGLGKEFERGINFMGTMTLSMTGMLILAPCISACLESVITKFPTFFDPSVIPAIILANDMGGAPLAASLCADPIVGNYNANVVSTMMGTTISFTIPFALGVVPKNKHSDMLFGILCGIVTIPVGCIVGGFMCGVPLSAMLINLIPLVIASIVVALGIIKAPRLSVKIFSVIGIAIRVVIIAGLAAGIFEFLMGIKLIPYSDSIENATMVVLNACCVMTGAFPLISFISRMLRKPLTNLGEKIGINSTSAIGFVSSLASNAITFDIMKDMDRKGVIMNSAFAVSAAFTFAGHLAFTMAFNADYVYAMIVSKLASGISALVLSHFLGRAYLSKSV